jgi:hypothetical protein
MSAALFCPVLTKDAFADDNPYNVVDATRKRLVKRIDLVVDRLNCGADFSQEA